MEDILVWLVDEGHGYPFIFLMLLGAGLGVPVPEDVPLLAAGMMAAEGGIPVPQVTLLCGLFVLTRDTIVFGLGYRYGTGILESRFGRRIASRDTVEGYQALIRQNALKVCFLGRYALGIRSAIFFAAGAARVRPRLFLLVDTIAAAISLPIFVFLGFKFATERDKLQKTLTDIRWVTVAVLVVLVVIWLLARLKRKLNEAAAEAQRREQEAAEAPEEPALS